MIEITSKIDFLELKKFLIEIDNKSKTIDLLDIKLFSKDIEDIWRNINYTVDTKSEVLKMKWLPMKKQKYFFNEVIGYQPFNKGVKEFKGGYREFREYFRGLNTGKTKSERHKVIEISACYPTSICILMEQKKILFGSKRLTDFYKSLYIHRETIKAEWKMNLISERIYRLARVILNSLFGLIYGDRLIFHRNADSTDEHVTLLDPWNKLVWEVKDMVELANVDSWVIDDENQTENLKSDKVKWIVGAHGFTVAQ